MSIQLVDLYVQLNHLAANSTYNPSRFFKVGPGEYGEHDRFAGLKNPVIRQLAKQYGDLGFDDIEQLLQSKYNEYRLLALVILVNKYSMANRIDKDEIYFFYMKQIDSVNNWNLVDASAHLIVGAHVYSGLVIESILNDLIVSDNLWHRRIGIVATWYFIRKNSVDITFRLAQKLVLDKHDLMHKAVGWMLREAGKRDEIKLIKFLDQWGSSMPRTMYRYAVERLPDYRLKK
jgi:3-methyladenine DNA glycosylase AlkD